MTVTMANPEDVVQSKKYPRAVLYILGNEFCEKYSALGLYYMLPLYLRNVLQYEEEVAIMMLHMFGFFSCALPILGGVLADSYIGKYQTIIYASWIHAAGNIFIVLSSTPWFLSPRTLALLGLITVTVGAGFLRPCVAPFGGEQFELPHQAKQLERYFYILYFLINVGATISAFSGPILRQDVKCLGQQSCYPLAFGIPAILMILSIVLFVCGKPLYKMNKPTSNVLAEVMKCIYYALRKKLSSKRVATRHSHWLDCAEEKFDPQLVKDVKEALRVLVLLLPLPVFAALNNQQSSSWIFQASKMDGVIEGWFTIKPEQLGLVNPISCVILTPLIGFAIYPMLAKIGIKRPLQIIVIGAFLNVVAFFMSAYVEYKLEPSDAKLPEPGFGQLRIFNGLPCEVELDPPINGRFVIPPLGALQWTDLPVQGTRSMEEKINLNNTFFCKNINVTKYLTKEILLVEAKSTSYVLTVREGIVDACKVPGFDDVRKSQINAPRLRVVHNLDGQLLLRNQFNREDTFQLQASEIVTPLNELDSGSYQIIFGAKTILSNLRIKSGGVYTLVLQQVDSNIIGNLHTITYPAALHILWALPQIFVMAVAEIFALLTYSVFTFTQVPESMKSTMISIKLLGYSVGDIIVVSLAKMKFFHGQMYRFLFYAGLMFLNVILLILLSIRYKYKEMPSEKSEGQREFGPGVKAITGQTEAENGSSEQLADQDD